MTSGHTPKVAAYSTYIQCISDITSPSGQAKTDVISEMTLYLIDFYIISVKMGHLKINLISEMTLYPVTL